MHKILFYPVSVFFLSTGNMQTCNSSSKEEKIMAIHVNYDLPAYSLVQEGLININNYYDVFYFRDLVLYRSNYRFDSLINGKLVFKEFRNFYFLFDRDSSYGYKVDLNPNRMYTTVRQPVDSTLAHISLKNDVYDSLVNQKPDSQYYDGNKNLVKVFLRPPTIQNPENFTLYFHYSATLKDVPETFSRMDNVRGMKLCKIRVLYSGGYYKEFKSQFPPRELVLEMKALNVQNRDEILQLFDRYKKGMP